MQQKLSSSPPCSVSEKHSPLRAVLGSTVLSSLLRLWLHCPSPCHGLTIWGRRQDGRCPPPGAQGAPVALHCFSYMSPWHSRATLLQSHDSPQARELRNALPTCLYPDLWPLARPAHMPLPRSLLDFSQHYIPPACFPALSVCPALTSECLLHRSLLSVSYIRSPVPRGRSHHLHFYTPHLCFACNQWCINVWFYISCLNRGKTLS